jgi:hypothetical protein
MIMSLIGGFPAGTLEWSGSGRGDWVVMTERAASTG